MRLDESEDFKTINTAITKDPLVLAWMENIYSSRVATRPGLSAIGDLYVAG